MAAIYRVFLMPNPLVSVLMPVFNGEKYIALAIESILGQTLSDFELIIFNDGSTDSTPKVIARISDHRIVLIESKCHVGLAEARNALVSKARGSYIAFMDADDIAMPQRLKVQVAFLGSQQVDICGSAYFSLYEASGKIKASKQRYSDADIRALLTVFSPLCNPSVMGKADIFKYSPYRFGIDYAEDYSLWVKLALAGCRFANLKEILITYRVHSKQVSQSQNKNINTIFSRSRQEYLRGLGISSALTPVAMSFGNRLKIALPFLFELNQKISGISVMANYEIYARFQFRGNGLMTPFTRLERLLVSICVSFRGNFLKSHPGRR